MILLVMHEKLIGRRCCFYIDGIQKCKIVFKLKIFNLHIQDFRCYFVYICLIYICLISNYSNSVLLLRILLLQIYPFIYCLIKKTKELLTVYSSREHPRVHLCCADPTFMLFHYSLFLKFVNNFEISCQDNEFALKVEFTL